jgi:HipA-like C-terminal domain
MPDIPWDCPAPGGLTSAFARTWIPTIQRIDRSGGRARSSAWEKVALDLARRAGITVPDSRLIRVRDRTVLIVDRFDRQGTDRIGYASAMTMLEASGGDQRSYLEIARPSDRGAVTGSDGRTPPALAADRLHDLDIEYR